MILYGFAHSITMLAIQKRDNSAPCSINPADTGNIRSAELDRSSRLRGSHSTIGKALGGNSFTRCPKSAKNIDFSLIMRISMRHLAPAALLERVIHLNTCESRDIGTEIQHGLKIFYPLRQNHTDKIPIRRLVSLTAITVHDRLTLLPRHISDILILCRSTAKQHQYR